MIEKPNQSSDHVTFMKVSSNKLHISKEKQREFEHEFFLKDQNIKLEESNDDSNTVIHYAMSSPSVFDSNTVLTDSDTDTEDDKTTNITNNKAKAISSDPLLSLSGGHWKTTPLFSKDEKNIDLHTAVQKRYSSLSMPANMTNKMTLCKTRHMPFGGGKVNKNNMQKINIYGQKIHVGLGFPTKAPIINSSKSKIIEMSDKSFNNLENLIQKIKDENNNTNLTPHTEVEKNDENTNKNLNEKEKIEPKNNNLSTSENEKPIITGQDISRVTTEMDSTKKQFIEMETNILSEFSNIKSSINQLLEDRKEIQKQHRIWLENMKKKIYQTKKETQSIEGKPFNSPYTK